MRREIWLRACDYTLFEWRKMSITIVIDFWSFWHYGHDMSSLEHYLSQWTSSIILLADQITFLKAMFATEGHSQRVACYANLESFYTNICTLGARCHQKIHANGEPFDSFRFLPQIGFHVHFLKYMRSVYSKVHVLQASHKTYWATWYVLQT